MRFVLKAAVRELERRRMIVRLNLLLLVITFMVGIFSISAILYQTRYYQGIHRLTSQKGVFVLTEGLVGEDELEIVKNSRELERLLPGTQVASFCYSAAKCSIEGYAQDYYESIVYDDACIEAFVPEMAEGEWLSCDANDTELQAVVSASSLSIHVGDCISVWQDGQITGSIRVIGVLKDGESVIGRANHFDAVHGFSFRDMYAQFNQGMDKPTLFLSRSNLEAVSGSTGRELIGSELSGGIFIEYSETINEELAERYREYLSGHIMSGGDKCVEFQQIESDGRDYLVDILLQQLPIWLCAFTVTVISMVCIELTSVKASMRDYAICSICGCSKEVIRKITLCEMLILNGAACMISIVAVALCCWAGLADGAVVRFRFLTLLYCIVLLILMTLAAAWYPSHLWKKRSAKEILNMTEEGGAL